MDLLALRYFGVVARHQHVGRAAEELGVAQPSVSRSVIRLEAELGAPLFDRVGRGIRLNRYGARFLVHVDQALGSLDDGAREMADLLSEDLGELTVAAETLLPLARVAARYHERHPRARLVLRQASAPRMGELLREGSVDLAVTSQPLSVAGGPVTVLSEEEVLLVAPDGHPLARRRPLGVADLAGAPFVLPGEGYWQRTLYDALVAGVSPPPEVVCETSEPGATLELVRAGLGVTLLPDVARRRTDGTGVTWRSLGDPRARRRLTLVRPPGRYHSRAARAFASLAGEHWREAVDPAQRKE